MPVKNYVQELVEDEETLQELAKFAIDYSHSIGFVGLWSEHKLSHDLAITPPMTLLPSPFPLELFQKAVAIQETLNELYFRISMDHDFLVEAYKNVVKADKWVGRQMELLKRVNAEGIRQKYVLQVQRVDYMAHWEGQGKPMELKQIEVNMGPGGPGFATKVAKLHRKTLQKVENWHGGKHPILAQAQMPPRQSIAEALYHAWRLFGDPKAVIVLVFDSSLYPIQHHEQIQFVQFELENVGRKAGHPLNVIRMTLEDCARRMKLNEPGDFSLIIDGNKRAAVVYMVYGYLPEHYATEKEWRCQLLMERSTAIVSPNIRLQLTGTKKVQQLLAKPGMVERFMPDQPKKVAALRSTFTGLWGLDGMDPATEALVSDAIEHPQNYVLKALRDDGIGNFFDEELSQMLKAMSKQERSAFILQQKIRPIIVKNYTKRPFCPAQLENVVNELGIFGTCISSVEDGGKILWNRMDAHVSKTKGHNVNQGGIGEGSGVIDSLLLFPEADFH